MSVRAPFFGLIALLGVPSGFATGCAPHHAIMGKVVDRDWQSDDLGARLDDARSRLKAREEVLQRYLAVLAEAKPESIVAVQREITRVVGEVEQAKGTIRYLEHRVAYSEAAISFQFQDRSAPSRDGTSSFRWLNTVNLADLVVDFQVGRRAARSGALGRSVPAGFAPYKRKARLQAVSPDDVLYRVRRIRNKPRADLPFWQEALRTRMVDAGYHLVSEGEVVAGARKGALIELTAANGEQDQTYLLALFVTGRKLVLVEAAGPVERFAPRRDAGVAAIQGLAI